MSIGIDDLRAAVSTGTITEAQAASITSLADSRRGVRENIEGLDEPFELFRGFNEVFIVVGLCILYSGWTGFTIQSMSDADPFSLIAVVASTVSLIGIIFLARYFTLKRRMVAPSIALVCFFGASATSLGLSIVAGFYEHLGEPLSLTLASALSTVLLIGYWWKFRVPFSMLLIGAGVFLTTMFAATVGGKRIYDPRDLFLLSADGPVAFLTILLGLIGLIIALRFDMSDPHRVTRRSQNGFWLHIIAAPAIVNTVALTLFSAENVLASGVLLLFLAGMALFSVAIDRRSFLVSGVGYVVALAFGVMEDAGFLAILILGAGLVLLGANWERWRRALMRALPNFPGKDRLPPWEPPKEAGPQTA